MAVQNGKYSRGQLKKKKKKDSLDFPLGGLGVYIIDWLSLTFNICLNFC